MLIDTGPLVALFDPQDPDHKICQQILCSIRQQLYTTDAVLAETFHMLASGSKGSEALMDFIMQSYVRILTLDQSSRERCFELMQKYWDRPMDYADASLVVMAEDFKMTELFTLNLSDFTVYRVRKGHRYYALTLVGADLLA